jgi:hypothetical protein
LIPGLDHYLKELRRYSEFKKVNPLTPDSERRGFFWFDFVDLEQTGFKEIPAKLSQPVEISFKLSHAQRIHLLDQLQAYGSSRVGLARLIGKNPVKKFYRMPAYVKQFGPQTAQQKYWEDVSYN